MSIFKVLCQLASFAHLHRPRLLLLLLLLVHLLFRFIISSPSLHLPLSLFVSAASPLSPSLSLSLCIICICQLFFPFPPLFFSSPSPVGHFARQSRLTVLAALSCRTLLSRDKLWSVCSSVCWLRFEQKRHFGSALSFQVPIPFHCSRQCHLLMEVVVVTPSCTASGRQRTTAATAVLGTHTLSSSPR